MSLLVVDTSAVLALAFTDEDNLYSTAVLGTVAKGGAAVPPLFWYEVSNGLVVAERRGRIKPSVAAEFLSALAAIPIVVDDTLPGEATIAIARKHSLTVYDASYLELAMRRDLPLATLDDALAKAAKKSGVQLFRAP